MTAESIARTAWNGTKGFYAATPADRMKYMLEFLTCNALGAESDDLQAQVIRECRRLAGVSR